MNDWIDKPTSVREGEALDTNLLKSFLEKEFGRSISRIQLRQFPSGYSNLTYLLQADQEPYILRRPPFGANIKSGHDMSREFRILSGLIREYPKVPRPILYCDDHKVIGAPIYLMEKLDGVILRSPMPEAMIPAPDMMAGIADALIHTFAELHQVDYRSAGLQQLGKPEGYVRRQVEGWSNRYLKARTDDIAEIEQTARWLADHQPAESGASLIHNDFKYDNLVLDPHDWTRVTGILDWEMATLGDPLMDLGSSLGYWINPDDPDFLKQLQLSPTTLPGNPSRGEMVEKYARISGRDIPHPVFYFVYGLFKVAVIVQQIYARYQKGLTKDQRFANLILGVRTCGTIAQQAIRKNRLDDLF